MSFLVVAPELLTSAAADLDGIGSALNSAHRAAAVSTTGLAAAGADEVSAAVAALFGAYGQEYQALSTQAGLVGRQLSQKLSAAAGSYAATDGAGASILRQVLAAAATPGSGASTGGAGIVGTAINDVNGFFTRQLSIYNFQTARGWAAFLLDYTWGLPETALGYGVQLINQFYPNAGDYDPVLSQQVGSYVYRGGIGIPGFATTIGNVTTSLGTGPGSTDLMMNHEEVHVWQNRIFGPLFTASYSAWTTGGTLFGEGYGLLHPNENVYNLVETASYYDNPWEVWAYVNDHNWPPYGAPSTLLWQIPTGWLPIIGSLYPALVPPAG